MFELIAYTLEVVRLGLGLGNLFSTKPFLL